VLGITTAVSLPQNIPCYLKFCKIRTEPGNSRRLFRTIPSEPRRRLATSLAGLGLLTSRYTPWRHGANTHFSGMVVSKTFSLTSTSFLPGQFLSHCDFGRRSLWHITYPAWHVRSRLAARRHSLFVHSSTEALDTRSRHRHFGLYFDRNSNHFILVLPDEKAITTQVGI
jgi:hypothetical protein